MSLPVVFIHKGNSGYLAYSLAQVKASNPQSKIYLIGDSKNSHYNRIVEHKKINRYNEGIKEFASLYKHLSTNPFDYELFCFQRWIILKNFMISMGMEKCCYLDSDVMVYTNLTEEQKKMDRFDIVFSQNPYCISDSITPCCTFINARAIEKFCFFLNKLYKYPNLFKMMEAQFLKRSSQNLEGGACDMTALIRFQDYEKSNIKFGYTYDVDDGSSMYDHQVNSSAGGFEMENGIKKIYFKDNCPFGKVSVSNKEIKFHIIHFQGSAKQYIKHYYTGDEIDLNYFLHIFRLVENKVNSKAINFISRLRRTLYR